MATLDSSSVDPCLCNAMRIRTGAKILSILDILASVIILITSIWEYTELKYVKSFKYPTPICDGIFISAVLACIFVAFLSTLFLIDAISDQIDRYRCLVTLYLLRRLISCVCIPIGLLISVVGLLQNGGFTRDLVHKIASEISHDHDMIMNKKARVDFILSGLMTVCILALPFDAWALVITYRYYRYSKSIAVTRFGNNEMKEGNEMHAKIAEPLVIHDADTEMTISETDFVEISDRNCLK